MALWQKFVFIVAGYWLVFIISQLPRCEHLKEYIGKKKQGKEQFKNCFRGRMRYFWVTLILITLCLAPLLTYFEKIPFFMDVEDAGMDWLMRTTQQNMPPAQIKNIPQFVWLDIDDETYKQWGEPLFTPRDRLLKLIKGGVLAEARLIIVDIDLSRTISGNGNKLHLHDKDIVDYLGKYPIYCNSHPHCPPIILARRFAVLSGGIETQYRKVFPELEQVVEESAYHIQWAAPLFSLSDDYVLRHWKVWQPFCVDGKPAVMASIEVTAGVFLKKDTPQQVKKILAEKLQPLQPHACINDKIQYSHNTPEQIKLGQWNFSTDRYSIPQRIRYSMPWSMEGKKTAEFLWKTRKGQTEGEFIILRRLPVQQFLEQQNALQKGLKDSIVIIGGSYAEGRDHYQTPLGLMPGALVIINAVHSLLEYGIIKPISNLSKWLIVVILVVLMSIILLCVPFILGQFFNLLVVLVMLLSSIILFRFGYWLDFTIPIVFAQLYQIIIFLSLFVYCLALSFWQWGYKKLRFFMDHA